MSEKSRFRGPSPPPRNVTPTYKVLRPQKDGPLDLTILDDTVTSVQTHWVESDEGGGITQLCTQHEPQGCAEHHHKIEWAGFVAVWSHTHNKRAVLRIGPRDYDKLAKALGCDLRWAQRRVKITAVNAGDGRTIAVEVVSEHVTVANVGPHSLTQSICLIFGVPRIPCQTPPIEPDPADVPPPPESKGGAP